jgi:6-phosphogluconolactonase
VEWSAVDFFWGDERAVPWDHADSNYRLAASLLDRADPGRVHRMRADEPDLAAAAQDYEREMRKALGPSARLDLALMGMGPDGHVCSLFPGHPLLAEKTRWVAAVTDSPKPPPKRMTMTLPALALTDLLVVGAFGAGKAEALHAALDDEGSALPVALVARAAARALFLLDEPAASRLARR